MAEHVESSASSGPLRAPRRSQTDPLRQATTTLVRWHLGVAIASEDELAVEEPLEIRLRTGDDPSAIETIAVIMRTPGADEELALGFLYGEGLLTSAKEVRSLLPGLDADGLPSPNLIDLVPSPEAGLAERLRVSGVTRAFTVNASCGVCGRNSIAAVCTAFPPRPADAADTPLTTTSVIASLPDQLRAGQQVFSSTGGLHAAGLFASDGTMIALREDVGRHNAVDKLVGHALLHQMLPLEQTLLLVSGRLSFEIVQKVVAAGIPLVAAVSAPSSLAVDLARASGVTLVAFLRGTAMNIYTHPARVLSGHSKGKA
jgi:FdhD protein